jgi:hypothetical protein
MFMIKRPELLLHPGPFGCQPGSWARPISSLLTECARCLVDLLVAGSRVRRAHLDGGSAVLEIEVAVIPVEEEAVEAVAVEVIEVAELGDAYLVLGVAGVGRFLDTHGLVGIVAPAGYINRLVYVAIVGFLLEVTEGIVVVTVEEARGTGIY